MVIDVISSSAGRNSQRLPRVENSEVVLYEPVHAVVVWLTEMIVSDAGNLRSIPFLLHRQQEH